MCIMIRNGDHITGTTDTPFADTGLNTLTYWASIRTPVAATGLQVRCETTDHLGNFSSQTSGLLDGSLSGSVSGSFIYEADGQTQSHLFIDSFGLGAVEYDWSARSVT